MKLNYRFPGLGVALIMSSVLTVPLSVHGQEANAESAGGIQEIIVTAERHEQSAQTAPLTIEVLSAEAVARAGLSTPADLTKLTTGLDIASGGSNSQIYIRGVGNVSYTPLSSPGVAFNVDGVYVGRPDSLNGNFYDIARIEILKGPQGTLYGRNANGGSINVVTNDPKIGVTSFDLNAETGNYDLVHVDGAANLPTGENSALRVAFNVMSRNGYLSNGTYDDVQQDGRVRFKWEPNTDLSLLLNADYIHIGGKGSNAVWLPRRPGSSPYEAIAEPAAQDYKHNFPTVVPYPPFTSIDNNDAHQDSNFYNVSAQLNWNFGFATLTALPAYRRSDSNTLTYDIGGRVATKTINNQESVEVRLGRSASAFTWVVGTYYYREASRGSQDVDNGDVPVPFIGGTALQDIHINYLPTTDAYAVFGQTTFEVFNGFRLIGGARSTYEKATLDGATYNLSPLPPTLQLTFPGQKSFDGFTYKLGVEYDITARNMLYFTDSTGFKAGGLTQTLPPFNVYQPETLHSFEAGSKNRFLDNNLQVNLSAFYWKYRNLQDARVNFDSAGNVAFITFNSGDATINGGTLDIVATPTRSDNLAFSVEYAHSKYDRFVIDTPAILFQPGGIGCPTSIVGASVRQNCSGFQVAHVPEWSGTADYNHTFPLTGGAKIVGDVSAKYSGPRWLAVDFVPAERVGSYTVVDANLTYRSRDDRWSVELFGRNLGQKVYYTGGIQTAFIAGLVAANIGAPRTYGIRGSFRFGD